MRTEGISLVTVYRDNKWRLLPTALIAAGDLITLTVDEPAPFKCQCLHKGSNCRVQRYIR